MFTLFTLLLFIFIYYLNKICNYKHKNPSNCPYFGKTQFNPGFSGWVKPVLTGRVLLGWVLPEQPWLYIFIANLLVYTSYYIAMKFVNKEKINLPTIVYALLALAFWIPGDNDLVFKL